MNTRVGERIQNRSGEWMEIIEYFKYDNITVKFDNGYIYKNRKYNCFKSGKIKSPYDKTLHNRGYLGEGDYKTKNGKNNSKFYNYWVNMFDRCYSDKLHKLHNTYLGCEVCKEWHNFQVFAKWCEENYYECGNGKMCLDKDILVKGNKIYSPETCVFVPHRINVLFIKKDANRGGNPIGVHYRKKDRLYTAQCRIDGKFKVLGYTRDKYDAFILYKQAKEDYIKKVANEYKEFIPNNLYDTMYNYEVDITD